MTLPRLVGQRLPCSSTVCWAHHKHCSSSAGIQHSSSTVSLPPILASLCRILRVHVYTCVLTEKPGGEAANTNFCFYPSASAVTREPPGQPDMVNFPQPNSILGAGHAPSSALVLFTLHQGAVSITSHVHITQRSILTTPTARHSMLATPTYRPSPLVRPASVMAPEASEQAVEVLKTAFSEYLEGNLVGTLYHKIIQSHDYEVDGVQIT